jgi:hypothetical protein
MVFILFRLEIPILSDFSDDVLPSFALVVGERFYIHKLLDTLDQ